MQVESMMKKKEKNKKQKPNLMTRVIGSLLISLEEAWARKNSLVRVGISIKWRPKTQTWYRMLLAIWE